MSRIDPTSLRQAFGSYMTGVTVVTALNEQGEPVGFTANSFASVSLDPPLLLVCPGKFLSSYPAFIAARRFAISILAEGQDDISTVFASSKGDRFAQVAHRHDPWGVPLIEDALCHFSCKTSSVHEAGDHSILIGEVEDYALRAGNGLGYVGGRYFSLGLEREALQTSHTRLICGAVIEIAGQVLLERTPTGWRPPQITCSGRGQSRTALTTHLETLGMSVQLGPVYSAFDARDGHSAYILGSADAAPPSDRFSCFAPDALPTLTYSTQPIADMMTRYAREAQTRDFTFYLGDAVSGDQHNLMERT